MKINENLQKCCKIIKKKINKHISAQKHHQTTIVASFFISSVIQFDMFFHPAILYENYLICILMKTFVMKEKILEKLRDVHINDKCFTYHVF